ncbi:MAG: beta-N-acetylglucosaminidase domain-containing protein, partial [Deltaproteobacteria bacterium]|nr:beta-N-acetylglucosaminidase domain-containing protein [Deltaproteobacteria bacterium]
APKLDPYHRSRWREPYPAEWMAHFGELARAAEQSHVRFVYALSPGGGFDPDGDDPARLVDKLGALFDVGVRDFCLLFDDLAATSRAADPAVQVRLITQTRAALRRRDPHASLCFISHYYAGTADDFRASRSTFDGMFPIPSATAYAAYAGLPRDVAILWTGPHVFANPLRAADAVDYAKLVERPVVVWDNFPVNDVVLSRELFLSPYRAREPGVVDATDGVLLNTMLQPEASKLALWTAGRFFADPEGYDPDAAFDDALLEIAGSAAGAQAVGLIAEQFRSHPLIGREAESPVLHTLADAFFADRTAANQAALRAFLARCAAAEDALQRDVPNAALVAELDDAARKLALYGEAGLLGLELIDGDGDRAAYDARLAAAGRMAVLVGGNTGIGPGLDVFLSGGAANPADVFGDFFRRLTALMEAGPEELQ